MLFRSDTSVHHDRILDEDRIRAVVGRRHLDHSPATLRHRVDVVLPLPQRQGAVEEGRHIAQSHKRVEHAKGGAGVEFCPLRNFRYRQGLIIEMSNSDGSDFLSRKITLRGTRRLALAVYRPGSFVTGTGL